MFYHEVKKKEKEEQLLFLPAEPSCQSQGSLSCSTHPAVTFASHLGESGEKGKRSLQTHSYEPM